MAIPKKEETIGGGGFGELWAGLHYPKDVALDPEVEANLRLRYSEAYTLIARTENQYKTEIIESHSNVLVSLLNAYARSLSAAASSASAGAQSQRAMAEMLKPLNAYFNASVSAIRGTVPEKLERKFEKQGMALTKPLEDNNKVLLEALSNITNPEQAMLKIRDLYGRSINTMFTGVIADDAGVALSKASQGERFHIKTAAHKIVTGQVENAYRRLLYDLSKSDDAGLRNLGVTLQRGISTRTALGVNVIHGATEAGLSGFGRQIMFTRTTGEQQAAKTEADESRKFLNDHYEFATSLGAGIPPEMFGEWMAMYDVGKQIADKGPEGYAEGLSKMPTPIEFNKAREILDQGLESLRPTDPLTGAMRSYIRSMPGFYRWAAVMGFKNPLKAVDYAVKHPGDINSFLRIQQETGGDIPLTELQGRMRQEGVFQTTGPLGKKFLTKPLERLFGFGIRPSRGYQIFPGETDVDKLQSAIDFVNKGGDLDTVAVERPAIPDLLIEDLPEEGGEAEVEPRPTDEPLLSVTATEKFLGSLSPDYRAYLAGLTEPEKKRALERFKRQAVAAKRKITGEKPPWPGLVEGRGEKRDTYDPFGEKGLPYASDEGAPPVPARAPAPPPAATTTERNWSFNTAWSTKAPSMKKEAKEALEALVFKFENDQAPTVRELRIFNTIPPSAVEWRSPRRDEAWKKWSRDQKAAAQAQAEQYKISAHARYEKWKAVGEPVGADHDAWKAAGFPRNWSPAATTTDTGPVVTRQDISPGSFDPSGSDGLWPEPGASPDSVTLLPLSPTPSVGDVDAQVGTYGLTGKLADADGPAFRIPAGDAARRVAAQFESITQDDVEKAGGQIGHLNSRGVFIPIETKGGVRLLNTRPTTEGVIGNGLGNRARGEGTGQ